MTRRLRPRPLLLLLALLACATSALHAEDGYDLWLRYTRVDDPALLQSYRAAISQLVVEGDSPTLRAARRELVTGLKGLLGEEVPPTGAPKRDGALILGTPAGSPLIASLPLAADLKQVGDEGYVIRSVKVAGRQATVIAANRDIGVLYGTFDLLRRMQTHRPVGDLAVTSAPKIEYRILDHWDNLDGSVERGYAGGSLWEWQRLPEYVPPRVRDYARANASIGINGAVLNNVNADATILTPTYLEKVAAIADTLRPYGIRVFLSARFSAPMEIGGLKTADPLDPAVRAWWKQKADEIYRYVPDFGGFLVKANSEGQPGPGDYGRTHADGANMLADAVGPHGGIVMWRAFVYSHEVPTDRVKQAYDEFKPLDGKFRDNVLVQVKNGPLDFQPREPFSPLFGAMPETPLMMEFQITQEYLGQGTDLVFLAPMWTETLESDTYAHGKGSTVARVIDGSLEGHSLTGIAGVSNIGNDRNWTGQLFGQANWYAYGRLAWDHELSSAQIADEWIRMTFGNDPGVVGPVKRIMLASREAAVNYMTPLGLAHIMATQHHYGPGAWVTLSRPDWSPTYYHKADTLGVGFDRTATGSDAVAQYFPPLRERFASRDSVPEKYLLWFHHVGWKEHLRSGRTLWDELVRHYDMGVDTVQWMQKTWNSLQGRIDEPRFREVQAMLRRQLTNARWWRDATLLYFQQFSRMPFPPGQPKPAHTLEYYEHYDLQSPPPGQ
ncbi:MAG TPA: alpha-glucuronidase family glycosyl hydrolase [Longimicrobiaceae bacterium]|nr:alpha-glucuronidase family glycosyl hydrolase [Longimicrobiaceae bacterium]